MSATKKKEAQGAQAKPKAAPVTAGLDLSALNLDELDKPSASNDGTALRVPFVLVYEDPDNPRTEFDAVELRALAADIAARGILQPIVTCPKDTYGRYKIRYGAKRRRAAEIAAKDTGIDTVPIVVADDPGLDGYAQVAENFHRSDLSPMDFAKFIRRKQEEGDVPATIARRCNVDKSVITYHIALLDHPPVIASLYVSGRCVSPKNLYELRNLHRQNPSQVEQFVATQEEITRTTIRDLAKALNSATPVGPSDTEKEGHGRGVSSATPLPSAPSSPIATEERLMSASETAAEAPSVGPFNDSAEALVSSTDAETRGEVGRAEAEKRLRKPLLVAEYEGRAVAVQLYRRPPAPGVVFVTFEDGSEMAARFDVLTSLELRESGN